MLEQQLEPAIHDTDAFGHVNNTALPRWFEQARTPLFRIICPSLDPPDWPLILVRIEVDFRAEIFYGRPVTVRTAVVRTGNSSFTVAHTAWQQGRIGAAGKAVLVYVDRSSGRAVRLPDDLRRQLEPYRATLEDLERPSS